MTHSTWPFPYNNEDAAQALSFKFFVLPLSKSDVGEQPEIVFLIADLLQNISVVEKG
jgi:hypothetical protein